MRYRTFCHTNPQLYALDALYASPGAYDRPTYPTAQMGSRRFYIGATLGGVEVDPDLQYITCKKKIYINEIYYFGFLIFNLYQGIFIFQLLKLGS